MTATASPKEYFKTLKLTELPEEASTFILDEILSDPELDNLDVDDEDFINVVNLIDSNYNAATILAKELAGDIPVTTGNLVEELESQIEYLKEMIAENDDNADLIAECEEQIEFMSELLEDAKMDKAA